MSEPLPLADWSDESVMAVSRALGSAGWSRWSPLGADILLFEVTGARAPRAEADVVAATARECGPHPGHSHVVRAEPDDPDREVADPTSVLGGRLGPVLQAFVRAHEDGVRHRLRRVDELARVLGVAGLDTVSDTVDYLVAAGVLCRVAGDDGVVRLAPAVPVPLPAERLALTAAERREEDALRWRELYEDTCHRLIGLLGPDDDERPAAFAVSVGAWARRLRLDPQEVRQGLLVLLDAPDFSADADVARVAEDTPFVLTVDWWVFDWTRVVVTLPDDGR